MKRTIAFLSIFLSITTVQSQIELFGERLPIEKKSIERKLIGILDKLISKGVTPEALIHKAETLFPFFDNVCEINHIPKDFKYLAVVESNLNEQATSSVGAMGLWQIMKETGRELGLIINHRIDERKNIVKSTEAAMLYLKRNKRMFRSWTLTAASYNCGAGCIQKGIRRSETNDFYSINLNKETSEYIYKILGVKLLFEEYFNRKKPIPRASSEPKKIESIEPIEIQIQSSTIDSISKETISSLEVRKAKKEHIKDLYARTVDETILSDSSGNIKIKIYDGESTKTVLVPYTIDQNEHRAYVRCNGVDIDKRYENYYAVFIDKDLGDGLNIVDYSNGRKIIIPKNLKSKFSLYEYR